MTRALTSMNRTTSTNSLDLYLHEIKDDRLLTSAEECALADAINKGDKDARARMIQANLRLVVKIARDYIGRGLSIDDLVGEGNLGLIRATQEYNPDFGTRFSTYASYWIKQAIRHALTNTTATIRLPAHMVGLLTKWRRAERALSKELGQAPTDEQIAVSLGLTEGQRGLIDHARRASAIRLECAGSSEESGWSADESPDRRESADSIIQAADEQDHLLRRLDRLDDRERMIVCLRYGLKDKPPLTLKEVGKRLGVTREWVRKIEIRAVKKLDDTYVAPEVPPNPKASDKKKLTASRRRTSRKAGGKARAAASSAKRELACQAV